MYINPKDFSLLSPDIWIADTGASNDGTAHNKGIIHLRKDELSFGTMGILVHIKKNRYLCNIPRIFCSNMGQEETKSTSIDAVYNLDYNFKHLV